MKQYYGFCRASIMYIIMAFALLSFKAKAKTNQVSLYCVTGDIYTGRYNTHSIEAAIWGCPGHGPIPCEDGYNSNNFNTRYPASGLKANATINEFILDY